MPTTTNCIRTGIGISCTDMIAQIEPILQHLRMSLYLNGHDLQHIHKGVPRHVCAGAGSKMRDDCNLGESDFRSLQSGFVACAASRTRFRIVYRDYAGVEPHVVDIPRAI